MPTSASRRVWEGKAGDYNPDGAHCLVLIRRNTLVHYTNSVTPAKAGAHTTPPQSLIS
jgi:hypothetical protein